MTSISSTTHSPQASRAMTIFRNTLSIFGSDVANRASSFALFILVARFLGERAFGQMSLAQSTFYFLGWSLAGIGLRYFLAREIAKFPEKTGSYVVHGISIVMLSSTLVFIGILIVAGLSDYPDDTRHAIIIMAITIYPYTVVTVLEAVFMGREKMQYIFYVNAPLNILNIVAVFLLLNAGMDLFSVIYVQVIAYMLIALLELYLMLRYVVQPELRVSPQEMVTIVRSSASFYAIDAFVAIGNTLSFYLISLVADENQVGYFSSAGQILTPITLLLGSVITSMLPVLTRQVEPGYARVRVSAQRLSEMFFWFCVPAVVGIQFVGPDLLTFVYGQEGFAQGGILLQLASFGLLAIPIVRVAGIMLFSTGNEAANLRMLIINSVLFILLNMFTVRLLGAIGAAVASLTIAVADIIVHNGAVRQLIGMVFNPVQILWRALVASLVMGFVLYVIPSHWHVMLRVALGGVAYVIALGAILLLTIGGPSRIKERYLSRGGSVAIVIPLLEGD